MSPDIQHSDPVNKKIDPSSGRWWKTAIVGGVGGTIGATAVSAVVLYDTLSFGAPDCAGKATQELVFQIAKDHETMMWQTTTGFVDQHPLPKSAELIAAERATDETSRRLKKAQETAEEWYARGRASCSQPCIIAPPPIVIVPSDVTSAVERANKDAESAQANLDSLRKTYANEASAARDAALADVKREMRYTLDVIRTTDKNLAGVLTCAATLKGDAGSYGVQTLSITYKVEKTSDGRLYGTVYGLQ